MQLPFPIPADEVERIRGLMAVDILDSEPEPGFDDVTNVAAEVCQVPVALVTFMDETRQWFKARVNFAETSCPRDLSFCSHALERREPLVIPDTCADPRFAANPLVTAEQGFRFYAGVPIHVGDGSAVGRVRRARSTRRPHARESASR